MCALRISKDRYLHADVQYNNQSGRWIEMRLVDLVVEKRREEDTDLGGRCFGSCRLGWFISWRMWGVDKESRACEGDMDAGRTVLVDGYVYANYQTNIPA